MKQPKRCPFCLAAVVLVTYEERAYFVRCATCEARGPLAPLHPMDDEGRAIDAAIDAWNEASRADDGAEP